MKVIEFRFAQTKKEKNSIEPRKTTLTQAMNTTMATTITTTTEFMVFNYNHELLK